MKGGEGQAVYSTLPGEMLRPRIRAGMTQLTHLVMCRGARPAGTKSVCLEAAAMDGHAQQKIKPPRKL